MSYLQKAHAQLDELLQFAQTIEVITSAPKEADWTALTRASELCANMADALAAYQSEVLHQKRQLAEAYPAEHAEYVRLREVQ